MWMFNSRILTWFYSFTEIKSGLYKNVDFSMHRHNYYTNVLIYNYALYQNSEIVHKYNEYCHCGGDYMTATALATIISCKVK